MMTLVDNMGIMTYYRVTHLTPAQEELEDARQREDDAAKEAAR